MNAIDKLIYLQDALTPGTWHIDGPWWIQGGDINPECVACISAGEKRIPIVLDIPGRSNSIPSQLEPIVALRNALPALIRVVEAAEVIAEIQQYPSLSRALRSLDAALGGEQ